MTGTSQEKKLGVIDFLKLIYNGHPEYSLIAVKAPIDQTVQAFIDFREGQQTKERMDYKTFRKKERKIVSRNVCWEQNISIRKTKEEGEYLALAFPFVQVRNSEWTVILRSLDRVGQDELYGVPAEAKALSAKLQTKAITLLEEDTSGAIAYELFENGELVEEFEHAGGDEDFRFESKLREKPDINLEPELDEDEEDDFDREYDISTEPRVQFVDALYCELGIYLPACYPVTDNGKPTLAVEEASENTIERADWLLVEETLESDRKEPDPDDAE